MICPIVKLASKLISIPSISPNDNGCQNILIHKLKKIGFTIEKINKNTTNNFWAYRGTGKTLTFLGHTDVVPPGEILQWNTDPFNPTIKNNRLYGRGSADMKGSIAAMIIAVERFISKNSNYNGRISFIITSDEESKATHGTIKVVKKLILRNEKIDYCIIGEPTSNTVLGDTLKNGRRGSLTGEIRIFGKQGHVAYPDLAENPIHKSLLFLHELTCIKWDNGNQYFDKTNLEIVTITSGNKINNMIPGEILIICNIRFNTETTVKSIKLKILNLLNKFNLKNTIIWTLSGLPFLTKNGILINIVRKSIKKYSCKNPKTSTSGGTSDGRFIALMKPEIVELGLINKTIHKINEYTEISDLKLLTLIYENIIEQVLL
ncbi:succinyl-diaminopimelate desuccinylase [Buchnera aphidicola]|uniref:Succinyl-diaminopimelate desuccinylase n=1 Tax=Buchnera aphidicola (Anoecia oenotherae) TaxID=1241833 RepID=A0A4D6XXJ5_9GAMM|nr:succinyl-diaminopimelate desuccinylase [Buchnera aphidicola]QCI19214.1 succinyl-diaminopimelate desuccinylase [Buchnera aphidicola (Anoecia oenotherae)]